MERDRDQDARPIDMTHEHTGHRRSKAGTPAIFELEHDTARDVAISNCRSSTIVARRRGHALGAFGSAKARHRHIAQGATPSGRKFERDPARSAKAMLCDDRRSAPRAARRKREIDKWTKGSRDGHCRTCRLRVAAAQAGR